MTTQSTRRASGASLAAVFVALVAACTDVPTLPLGAESSATMQRVAAACATAPTAVVTDEASLHAAIATAPAGAVIAVQGTIRLRTPVEIRASDVTLTCATAGSGLAFAAGLVRDPILVYVIGSRVAISGLVLDATRGNWAVYSFRNDGQRTEGNDIRCGDACGFWVSSTNAVVSDNKVTHAGRGSTGLHFQSGIDGTRIERNTVTALAPVGFNVFGALRPRDGRGVIVADNVVKGPWSNSVSAVNLNSGEFLRNVLEGATRYGFAMNVSGSPFVVFSRGNLAIANRVRDAGIAGFLLRNACDNVFRGNPTLGTTPVAFSLALTTGGNIVAGTAGVSIDDGARDCDNDGTIDPNSVSGTVTGTSASMSTLSASMSASQDDTPMTATSSRYPSVTLQ